MNDGRIASLIEQGVDRGLIEYVMYHCRVDEDGDTANAAYLLELLASKNMAAFDTAVTELQMKGIWSEDEDTELTPAEEAELKAALDAVMALDEPPRDMAVQVQYLNTSLIVRKLFYGKKNLLEDLTPGKSDDATFETNSHQTWDIDFWSDSQLTVDKSLDAFDFAILDAIYTLYCNDITIFPTKWVDMLLSGSSKRNSTAKSIAKIDRIIDKLRMTHIRCTIDGEPRDETPLLSVQQFGHSQGRIYYLNRINDLYAYAQDAHQVANTPASYFNTSTLPKEYAFADTETAIIIKRRVIARVMRILKLSEGRAKLANWNRISLIQKKVKDGGLFPELGLLPDLDGLNDAEAEKRQKQWRTKQKPMYIQVVKGTLENLKRNYAILDYEEHKDNDSKNPKDPVTGFDIICFTKTEKAALSRLRDEQKPQYVKALLDKRKKQ